MALAIRDRIREFRRVPARDLVPHAANWRRHPSTQRKALEAILREVGWADAVLAYEMEQLLARVGEVLAQVIVDCDAARCELGLE
jgi:hypothetical protein